MPDSHRRIRWCLLTVLTLLACAQAMANTANLSFDVVVDDLGTRGINILYSTDLVDELIRGDLKAEEATVASLGRSLTRYELRLIEIAPDSWAIIRQPSAEQAARLIVTGVVTDGRTGRPISGAELRINAGKPVFSQDNGSYLLLIDAAERYRISLRADAYDSLEQTLDARPQQSHLIRHFELTPRPLGLDRMMVSASTWQYRQQEQTVSLSAHDLSLQVLTGDDPLRAIQQVPGVVSNGLSGRAHVRGGNLDETLIVLDGLELRDPYHLKDFFGLFSSINLGTVEQMDFYTGVFPAQFDGRLSGVIDITTINPTEQTRVQLDLGTLNNALLASGTSADQDTAWLFSARRSSLDLIAGLAENDLGRPRYYDSYLKVSHRINPTTDVSAHFLLSSDELSLNNSEGSENASAEYVDHSGWLQLNQSVGEAWQHRLMLSHSDYDGERRGEKDGSSGLAGNLNESIASSRLMLGSHWTWQEGAPFSITLGGEVSRNRAELSYQSAIQATDSLASQLLGDDPIMRQFVDSPEGWQQRAYADFQFQGSRGLSADLGVHYSHQSWIDDPQWSPRLHLGQSLGDRGVLRLGLGRHHQVQTLDELLFEDSNPVYFDPVRVDSLVLSYDHAFSPTLDARIESYYRRYENTQPRYENAFNPRVIIPELGVDRLRISPEAATVKGLELSVSGRQEAWSWRANYSYSDAHDVVVGVEQPRTWDQHHSINLGAHWQGQRWSFASQLSYHDGWPTTALDFDPQVGQVQRSQRNGERLRDYVNIDLKAERRFTLAGGEARWWIAVSNALGTDNVCCIEYEFDEADDGLLSLQRREENWYPLFPSIGFQWRWSR